MNNLQNFDMISRALKQEKDEYTARFEEKQQKENERTALTYESLTAPFIEASGLNLLKKGIKYAGKSVGLSDSQIDSLGDIGDSVKSGDIGGAINKVRALGKDSLTSPEQQRFLEDLKGKLDNLKENTNVIKTNAEGKVKSVIGEVKPRVVAPETTVESKPLDLDSLSDAVEIDPATNQTVIRNTKNIDVPTDQEPVLDDNGNAIPDEYETVRQSLEDNIAGDDENLAKQSQRELKKLLSRQEAPEPENTYQSAMDFLAGKEGSASSKWSRKPAEMDDISNLRLDNEPRINPADIAPDIEVPSNASYMRGGLRISAKKLEQRAPRPQKSVRFTEPEVEAPAPKGVTPEEVDKIMGQEKNLSDNELKNRYSKLSSSERNDYIENVNKEASALNTSPAELSNVRKGKLLNDGLERDKQNGRGLGSTPESQEAAAQSERDGRTILKNRYDNLSDEGRSSANDATQKLVDDYTIRRQNIPLDQQERIISQQESQDSQRQLDQSQPDTTKPPPVEQKPTTVEPVEDKPTLSDDLEDAGDTFIKTDAELGGEGDIAGDVIALGASIGSLLFGLNKSHASSKPPPLLQVNPTFQEGEGQV